MKANLTRIGLAAAFALAAPVALAQTPVASFNDNPELYAARQAAASASVGASAQAAAVTFAGRPVPSFNDNPEIYGRAAKVLPAGRFSGTGGDTVHPDAQHRTY